MSALLFPILAALGPIFGSFLLGAGLRASGFLQDAFWDGADRLIFWVLFPCLLFTNTARADLSGPETAGMAFVLVLAVLGTALLARISKPAVALPDRSYVSVYQAAFRMNAYVGLAASAALLPVAGPGLAAIAVAIIAPLINGLGVIALTGLHKEADGPPPSRLSVLLRLFRNPLILATVLGAAVNLIGIPIPAPLWSILAILSAGALPLALISVGAGLRFEALRGNRRGIAIGTGLKLIAAPLLTIGLAYGAGLGGAAALVAVIFTALPTSASSYQMTKTMGGDAPLMAGLITAQTVAAAVTMPVLLMLAAALFAPGGLP